MADGVPRRLLEGDLAGSSAAVELVVASSWMALAAALIYLAAREVAGRVVAAAAAGIFAFCTPAWSTASRALWQHGPSILLLSAALLLALWAERRPGVAGFLGIPLALAFFVRPTNAVPAALLAVYVFVYHRRHLTGFLGGALAVALLFDFYNTAIYGTSLAPYSFVRREHAAGLSLHERMPEALIGNLFSPARGLFIYMPVALLAAAGAALRPPSAPWRRLRPFLAGSLVLHWVLVSTYEDWWGGHCYGPRYMSEMVPFLVFLLIPVLERASGHLAGRRYALATVLAFLTAASLGLNYLGACHWSVYEWNSKPQEIRTAERRVWDWTDPPFLRPFRE
jgi:hypothetical protein